MKIEVHSSVLRLLVLRSWDRTHWQAASMSLVEYAYKAASLTCVGIDKFVVIVLTQGAAGGQPEVHRAQDRARSCRDFFWAIPLQFPCSAAAMRYRDPILLVLLAC